MLLSASFTPMACLWNSIRLFLGGIEINVTSLTESGPARLHNPSDWFKP